MFETEAAAWREVARQLVEERVDGGLCSMISTIGLNDRVEWVVWEVFLDMKARLVAELESRAWAYPIGRYGTATPAY
ncbi:MAG: hypothetical protein ACK5X3_13515, partial [Pseudomonadota bacterium]